MSLLDKASLIVTPNAYEESKLYSVVPNTTLGDMDVVRATTATRVNSAGLIEVVPRNLLTYSQQFDNFNWGSYNQLSLTANAGTSPDGTNNAFLFTKNTVSTIGWKSINISTLTSGVTYTLSAFVKKGTVGNKAILRIAGGAFPPAITYEFNFDTETITNGGSFTKLANGWYRISGQRTATSTGSGDFQIGVTSALATDLNNVLIYGAQLENFATATEYFPTTTRLNIPRIDYTNGSCPSLLVEPQRTNLLTYSNDFSNVSWVKQELTLTANSIISPDGTLNAYKLTPTTVNSPHQLNKLLISAPVSNTMSFYAKKGGYDLVECLDGASGFNGSKFNLNTGTFTNQGTGVGSMISVGNGWYRCIVTVVTTGIRFYINNSSSYIGDGTSGIYLWCTQFEAASYPTSYIPTIASTVTRNADVISKTGISSLIGQTEGTIYYEFSAPLVENITRALSVSGSDTNNRINISTFSSSIFVRVDVGGANQVNSSAVITVTNMNKVAFRYKANDFSLYVNGVNVITDTSGITFPAATLDRFSNIQPDSSSPFNGNIKQVTLFKTALSNSELAQLTTL